MKRGQDAYTAAVSGDTMLLNGRVTCVTGPLYRDGTRVCPFCENAERFWPSDGPSAIRCRGPVLTEYEGTSYGDLPEVLPRVGVCFRLTEDYTDAVWYGRGENTPLSLARKAFCTRSEALSGRHEFHREETGRSVIECDVNRD